MVNKLARVDNNAAVQRQDVTLARDDVIERQGLAGLKSTVRNVKEAVYGKRGLYPGRPGGGCKATNGYRHARTQSLPTGQTDLHITTGRMTLQARRIDSDMGR